MEKALLLLLNQSVSITPATGLTGDGIPSYGSAVIVKACIFEQQKLVRGPLGENVVSTTQTYVDGATAVTTSSKIVLPDGTVPLILAVSTFPDEYGAIHHKIIYT